MAPDAPSPTTCSACRGTGRLVSKLGGTEHPVRCPWCDGGGRRLAGHDAQASGPAEGDEPLPPAA